MTTQSAAAEFLPPEAESNRIEWVVSVPFFLSHLIPLGAIWTGVSWFDVGVAAGTYLVGMFFVTAGYHRFFAHRAYKTGRVMQFILAFCAQVSAQKGVLWWAGHHRAHHKYSDTERDVHSPKNGFWWSHVTWILSSKYSETDYKAVKDLAKYPELRWLNRWFLVPPILLGAGIYLLWGPSALVFGFFTGIVALWHGTFLVNSLAHVMGRERYETGDTSKNSLLIALLTHGEGWHNNHHHYQSSVRQGFFWWEIDVTYYILKVLSWVGLIWDLRQPPKHVIMRDHVARVAETNLGGLPKPVPGRDAY